MDFKELFKNIGLTEIESKIYLCLLRNSRSSVSQISIQTGLYRPTVYKNISKLTNKGLVSKIKYKKRIFYLAENPEKLHIIVNNLNNILQDNMPELSRIYNGNQKRPFISYYEGKKAIMDIYENIIERTKKGDSIYRYESPREVGLVSKYYPKLYFKKTSGPDGQLDKYVITNESTAKRRTPKIWRHTKYIPKEFDTFDQNIAEIIYKDTVVFIDYDTETATLIKNQRFADFQLKIFKMFFNSLKDRGN